MKAFSKDREEIKNQKNIITRRLLMFLALVLASCAPAQTNAVDVQNTLAAIIQTGVSLTQTALSSAALPSSTLTPVTTIIEPTSSPLPTLAIATGEPQFFALISGQVDGENGTGTIDTIYVVDAARSTPESMGNYSIRFEDVEGNEIESHSFEPETVFDGPSGMGMFVLFLPWNTGTTRIVLLKDEVELDSRSASKNKPAVTLISPNGGENLNSSKITVSWSAEDADGDTLRFVVQYSVDNGLHWVPIAVDYTDKKLDLDLSFVDNTDVGLVRVLASDGFHTSQDESDAVFIVATQKPVFVDILDEDGAVFSGDQTVILDGEAYTVSGQLPEDSLVWSSDLDGELAVGEELAINARELSEGTHRITLTAHDDEMQSGSDTITIQIYRDFSSLSVETTSLKFAAKLGDTKTIEQIMEIWHLGSHPIKWSATANQKWILLFAAPALDDKPIDVQTPSDLIVFADPTGLPIGVYTGTITITSNAEGIKTHTVAVTLEIKK